ncbi:hypothetical protein GWI33_000629 [Rhynchophorus ferrugineus]|uniref:Uncharacterized protein n=1 Tax=Rhynchophorus ferrugineus TaxID=354439 RepID=A0A834MIC1_RHYFE|nr:hypothetical protein GWI33_000629 [Rhynchophorus ferrugineus]
MENVSFFRGTAPGPIYNSEEGLNKLWGPVLVERGAPLNFAILLRRRGGRTSNILDVFMERVCTAGCMCVCLWRFPAPAKSFPPARGAPFRL